MIEAVLGEVEDLLFEMRDDIYEKTPYYDISVEEQPSAVIETDGVRVLIPDLGYSVRFGEYSIHDEEDDVYEELFSVTLIYDIDESDPQSFLGWEQDSVVVTLFNFLKQTGVNMSVSSISRIKCIVEIEDDKEEQK